MLFFFFFNDTATTEIYTLSLHDALPISARAPTTGTHRPGGAGRRRGAGRRAVRRSPSSSTLPVVRGRSGEPKIASFRGERRALPHRPSPLQEQGAGSGEQHGNKTCSRLPAPCSLNGVLTPPSPARRTGWRRRA